VERCWFWAVASTAVQKQPGSPPGSSGSVSVEVSQGDSAGPWCISPMMHSSCWRCVHCPSSLQEVPVASLLRSSGLSADVLLQALRPLIAEGGPLSCSQEEEPCGGEPAAAPPPHSSPLTPLCSQVCCR